MPIKVAVAQMSSIAGDVDANLEKVEALMRSAALLKAQLVIVPETFSTGYDVADRLAEVADRCISYQKPTGTYGYSPSPPPG